MRYLGTFALSIFLLMTNRWLSYEDGIRLMYAADTQSSMSIAQAAPRLPDQPIPFHHAQRIAVPYLLGLAAKAVPLSYHACFTVATLLCFAGIVSVYLRILDKLRISPTSEFILLSLLVLNPYTFRFYFAVPGMVYDLVFVLGLTLAVLGLVEGRYRPVIVGLVVAAIARQTALLMLPGLIVWIVFGSAWRQRSARYMVVAALGLIACSSIIYLLTAHVAAQFATPSTNLQHLTRLLHGERDFGTAELMFRGLIPIVFPFSLLLGVYLGIPRRPALRSELVACLMLTSFIMLQPILGGGTNITRLSALGLIPCFVALAMVLRESQALDRADAIPFALLQSMIVFGSFHHMYTYIGGQTTLALHFAGLYMGLAVVAGCLVYLIAKAAGHVSQTGSTMTKSISGV